MSVLIENCRLISPDIDIPGASILIESKSIQKIYLKDEVLPRADKIFNVHGKIAMPGFIDIHSHGASGYDVTDANPDGLSSIMVAKLDEGITTLVPTTLTLPEEDLAKTLQVIAGYMQKEPFAGKIAGVHLEGPYINPNYIGAQNPDFIRKPDIEEVIRLNSIAPVLKVSFAIEMEGGIDFTRELTGMGITPSVVHSDATCKQFEHARLFGLSNLSHFCNRMSKLHHRDIGLVGAGMLYDDVTVEIICDKIHLCPEMISLIFKVKSIDRVVLITDSVSASWLEDGEFDLGGIEIIVENGEARLKESGALAGSTAKYYECLKNVYEITGLPLAQLVKTTSWNQAQTLGLQKLGRIEPGYYADIVILDEDFVPRNVFVNGEQRR